MKIRDMASGRRYRIRVAKGKFTTMVFTGPNDGKCIGVTEGGGMIEIHPRSVKGPSGGAWSRR